MTKTKLKFTKDCGQSKPNKKSPKNEDVPRKDYNPKILMDELPTKKNKKMTIVWHDNCMFCNHN